MGTTNEQGNRRLPTGERLLDLTYEQVWLDAQYESILTDADRREWQRHEAAKPENVAWRERKLAEHDARRPEPEPEIIVSRLTEADDDLGATTEISVFRLPNGLIMQCGRTETTRPLSEREHAELDRRIRRRLRESFAAAGVATTSDSPPLAAVSGRRSTARRRGTGTRPATRRVRTTSSSSSSSCRVRTTSSSSSSSSGDGDSDPPAEPASAGLPPSLAPSSRLTLREVRRDYVARLHARYGLHSTIAILCRLGWPVADRALALADAGIGQQPSPGPDRARWRVAQLVQDLRLSGCKPEELAWRRGAWQAICPACTGRYRGRRPIVEPGEHDAALTCAIGCKPDAIRLAMRERIGGAA